MACFIYDPKCDVINDAEVENETNMTKKKRFFTIFTKQFAMPFQNIYSKINWKMVHAVSYIVIIPGNTLRVCILPGFPHCCEL